MYHLYTICYLSLHSVNIFDNMMATWYPLCCFVFDNNFGEFTGLIQLYMADAPNIPVSCQFVFRWTWQIYSHLRYKYIRTLKRPVYPRGQIFYQAVFHRTLRCVRRLHNGPIPDPSLHHRTDYNRSYVFGGFYCCLIKRDMSKMKTFWSLHTIQYVNLEIRLIIISLQSC